MRQGAENQRSIGERRVFRGQEGHGMSAETRRHAALIISGGERQLELRMVENECTELTASISACAKHSDGYSIHPECIIMRAHRVNGGAASYRPFRRSAMVFAVEREPGMKKRDRHEAILSL